MPKQMHLALDVSWTQVESAWRMPGSWVGRHYPDVGLFEDIARIAERGLFDMIFFGDGAMQGRRLPGTDAVGPSFAAGQTGD